MDETPTQGQPPSQPTGGPSDMSPTPPESPERVAPPDTPPERGATFTPEATDLYSQLDYDALLEEFPMPGIDAKELSTIYGPARQVLDTFGAPGLAESLGPAGDDPNVVRALASFARDYRSLIGEAERANRDFESLAEQLGADTPEIRHITPLQGEALERKITDLLDRYLPQSASRRGLEASGFFRQPAVRQTLERMAQEAYRIERSLELAGQWRQSWKAQLDAPGTLRTLPDGRQFSNGDLDVELNRLWSLRHAAARRSDINERQRLDTLITRLGRTRYGG